MAATVTAHNADVAERRITELEDTGAITAPGIRKLRDEMVAAGTYDDRAAMHIIAACTEILIAVEDDPDLIYCPACKLHRQYCSCEANHR